MFKILLISVRGRGQNTKREKKSVELIKFPTRN